MTNAQKAAQKQLESVLQDAGLNLEGEELNQAVKAIAAIMAETGCSPEQAVEEMLNQAQSQQTHRVEYNGKTPSGYRKHMSQATMQHIYEAAQKRATPMADTLETITVELAVMEAVQREANGSTWSKINDALSAYRLENESAENNLILQIHRFQETQSEQLESAIKPDFFTKRLSSSFSNTTKALPGS